MSTNQGIIAIAATNATLFPGTLANDFLLCSSNVANVWIGASNGSNSLQVGSNATFTSNLNVSGTATFGGITSTGAINASGKTITASTFVGSLSGNAATATNFLGTPNLSVGTITSSNISSKGRIMVHN